jgi:hypothetical protein
MKMQIKHIILLFFAWAILLTGNSANAYQLFASMNKNLNDTELVSLSSKLIKIEQDSITSNVITKVWYASTELKVEIYQVVKQQEITITVYNMLGKEVLVVFKGTSSSQQEEVYSATFNLPNGIYICVLQGKNFRDSEKFIISR